MVLVSRSRVVLGLWVALAGCGRFGFDAAGDGGNDPSGDGTVTGDGSAGDTDGDGVANPADNCPDVLNPFQHDEDSDGVGDACDNCPTFANTDQANVGEINNGMAADALGDACDPRPTLPGDSVRLFVPFTDAVLGNAWSVVTGTWTDDGDNLVQAATTASDQRVHASAINVNDYLVETAFTFSAFDAGNVNGGIVFRMGGNNGWLCGVFRDDTMMPITSYLMIWTIQNGAANFEKNSATIAVPMPGQRYRMFAGAFGSNLYCALDNALSGTSAPFTSNQNATGVPGLRTNRVAGSYAYFLVYDLGGAL
jgi:hypothetical protein